MEIYKNVIKTDPADKSNLEILEELFNPVKSSQNLIKHIHQNNLQMNNIVDTEIWNSAVISMEPKSLEFKSQNDIKVERTIPPRFSDKDVLLPKLNSSSPFEPLKIYQHKLVLMCDDFDQSGNGLVVPAGEQLCNVATITPSIANVAVIRSKFKLKSINGFYIRKQATKNDFLANIPISKDEIENFNNEKHIQNVHYSIYYLVLQTFVVEDEEVGVQICLFDVLKNKPVLEEFVMIPSILAEMNICVTEKFVKVFLAGKILHGGSAKF